MERLTERETRMVNSFDKDENYKAELYNRLASYEDAEEQGLLVRLPKNFKLVAARKKTERNAIINELIHAMRPYADDDRLFKAVDAVRAFVAQQNEFIDTLSNAEAALGKEEKHDR